MSEGLDWQPDDPRLAAVAYHLVGLFEAGEKPHGGRQGSPISKALAGLDSVFLTAAPYGGRLLGPLEQRGWAGWTMIKRIETPAGALGS